jgi:dipeptidyl-peptidase III
MSAASLRRIVQLTSFPQVADDIMTVPPFSLGFPSQVAQSMYYPCKDGDKLTRDEIEGVSRAMELHGVHPENTRITRSRNGTQKSTFLVLQASSRNTCENERTLQLEGDPEIILKPGDHAEELSKICDELQQAQEFAANDIQRRVIQQYISSFHSGDVESYRESQRTWVRDLKPRVESIFGFVEPYRDPFGTRAEFEGLVAISDPEETMALTRLVEHSDRFIRRLPWVASSEKNGSKGPFEKSLFEPPDFTSIHGMYALTQSLDKGADIDSFGILLKHHLSWD